ncbi:MAG: MORN repeat-containing protein, partial [Blautia sp.]
DSAIDKMEKYMQDKALNPDKVEIKTPDMPTPDYSNVYGINLGIIFGDDGSIVYIGEFSNGKANGYGEFQYTDAEGNSGFCCGTFTEGVFVKDEKGNKIDGVPQVTGEFVSVKGLTNTASSESVANKAAADEEMDREKATAECDRYLQMVEDKSEVITNIQWIRDPKVDEDFYYFSCTVNYGNLEKNGTVTVLKQSDGSFEALGLNYYD